MTNLQETQVAAISQTTQAFQICIFIISSEREMQSCSTICELTQFQLLLCKPIDYFLLITTELSPVIMDELQDDDELKSQFNQLIRSILSIDIEGHISEEEIAALNKRVCCEVTATPILARTVRLNNAFKYLLEIFCTMPNELFHFHPAIKCLIKANPSALLWKSTSGENIIHDISGHPSNCVLMPWIATNYQWVLNHGVCLENPPVIYLIRRFANRRETTGCTAATIRQFFDAYPRGLTQQSKVGRFPLCILLLSRRNECEPDLFKWMAEQCPSSMFESGSIGKTPLYYACVSLIRHLGDYSSEICKYLISKCPESARIPVGSETLPVHHLIRHRQHRQVKEVIVSLLREYPESYGMAAVQASTPTPAPSSIPFIQRIKSLLDEERELKENIVYLQEVSGVFQDAVNGTKTPSSLASSTCDSFYNWAESFTQDLEARMEQVLTELQDECNAD